MVIRNTKHCDWLGTFDREDLTFEKFTKLPQNYLGDITQVVQYLCKT